METYGASAITLSHPEQPYKRLHISSSGELSFLSGCGKHHLLIIERMTSYFYIRSCASRKSSDNGTFFHYVCMTSFGELTVCVGNLLENNLDQICPRFLAVIEISDCFLSVPIISCTPSAVGLIPDWQIRRFINEGYVHLHQIVDTMKVLRCQKFLTHLLGVPGSVHAGGVQEGLGKLDGNATSSVYIRALITDKVLNILKAFFGDDNLDPKSISAAQIALRFPELCDFYPVENVGKDSISLSSIHI